MKCFNPRINRIIILAFSFCIAFTSSSCGFIVFNNPDTDISTHDSSSMPSDTATTTSTGSPETTAKIDPYEKLQNRLNELPNRNLGSSSVIIATTDTETICPTETESEVVAARAVVARTVEKKYNTLIIADPSDSDSIIKDAKEAFASGMYYADLLALPQNTVGTMFASGILANMYSLPFTDYTREYYNQELISEAVLGNELRAVSGAANFNPEYLSCVYFNRGIIEKYTLENPYDLVYSGKWTWDKFGELAKAASDDLNGNPGNFGHGAEFSADAYADLAISSMGIKYVSNPEGQLPIVNYMADEAMSERAKGIVDKLYKILYTDKTAVPAKQSARELFTSDSLLFYTDRLYIATWIPNSSINWGILPLPKYDEAQDGYLSPLSGDSPVFCALANTPNYETSGLILEALNAASYEYVLDVYMNNRINFYLRDNDSINMLELIINGTTNDFTHMFASGFTNLAPATYSAIYGALTTKSTLDALYKRYQPTANKEIAYAVKIYK